MARLIDADALKKVIYFETNHLGIDFHKSKLIGIAIDNAPTIEAEPVRHGKWIWEEQVYNCSVCSHKAYGNILECMDGTYKYCPNCGARMEIEENERKRANETNTTI